MTIYEIDILSLETGGFNTMQAADLVRSFACK